MKIEIDLDDDFVALAKQDMIAIGHTFTDEPTEQEVKEYIEEVISGQLSCMREYFEEQTDYQLI